MQLQMVPAIQQIMTWMTQQQQRQQQIHRHGTQHGHEIPLTFFNGTAADAQMVSMPAIGNAATPPPGFRGKKCTVDQASDAILQSVKQSKVTTKEEESDDGSHDVESEHIDHEKTDKDSKKVQKGKAKGKAKKVKAMKVKAKKVKADKGTAKKTYAFWAHEQSRFQIMGRSGAKGPGSTKAFKYGEGHGSFEKAKREADAWVAKLNGRA